MPQVPSLDEQWNLFKIKSELDSAPSHQRYEMEYAFKCGAASVLISIRDAVAVLAPENQGDVLTNWFIEFGAYIKDRVRKALIAQYQTESHDDRKNN